tara:strand:- start:3149 stop:3994 length:846 start_codon:yes stop_codon:yes gene_type:complete
VNIMGLLDKAAASGGEEAKPVAKAKPVATAKPVAKAKAVKAKPARAEKPVKAKKARAPRARPVGLAEDYELATNMNRRISWLVNFIINFGVLFAALFIASSDTGIITTILFATSGGIIILNAVFIPMKFSRNLGQFVSRTKFIRGDGSNPLFLHGILENTKGLFALIGLISVATQFQKLTEADNTTAIVFFSMGTLFIIVWFVDRFLRNGSEMGQGLYDLLFGAYLVKYVPSEDEKATGVWARLENMGNFGDQLLKRQEERKAKKEEKASEAEEETNPQED